MTASELVQKYDLTERQAQFLDRQFVHQILKYAATRDTFSQEEVRQADLQVISNTLLVDELAALGAPEATVAAKKAQVAEIEAAKEKTAAYAQQLYSAGKYEEAIEILTELKGTEGANAWGLYAAKILAGKYDSAVEDISSLQEVVDQRQGVDSLLQLNNRTWLIHWMLFSLFRTENGTEKLCDTFLMSQYMSSIQASCPWILRHLAVAIFTTHADRPRTNHYQRRIKDIVRSIVQEKYEYTDPVLEFVTGLYIDYDFETIGEKLRNALTIIENDFFVNHLAGEFANAARFLIVDIYFKVHNTVSVSRLAPIIDFSVEETTKYLATLVSEGRLDTTQSDVDADIYTVSHVKPSVFQQIKDKTKSLDQRSKQALTQAQSKNDSQIIA